jgi:uncharacterized protein YqeY
MNLKELIDNDIKTAMKARDQVALRTLRSIKSAILLLETAEGREPGPITEAEGLALLTRQLKQRRESIKEFTKNHRLDLAQSEQEEAEVIERYLPKQLSQEEIRAELTDLISQLGAAGLQDLGKVMKAAKPQFSGRADGEVVATLAKQLLGS